MFRPVSSKVDFPALEREIMDWWQKNGIVEKYLHKNDKSSKRFSFIDGPITANNPMGVHHGWGRTYKDLWQRYFNMRGYKQRFQNGFDCQGLWVEVDVEKELGFKNKKDIEIFGAANFVNKCKERVLKYAAIQTEQSKRLGYFMDWDNSYFTMSDENNYTIWHFLKICFQRGWIYKGRESVPWCPRCETAISQHEMLTEDYKEIIHESIYLELPLAGREKEYLLVWTTTPWTIPANIAVAVDAKMDYALVEGQSGDFFWAAKDLVGQIFKDNYRKIVKTVKGKELVGLVYRGPFDDIAAVKKVKEEFPDKFHTIIATDKLIMPITTFEGTGLVHTAVSAGAEDFLLGKKYGLPMIPIIADNADYLPEMGFLSGKNAKKNPRVILDYLLEKEKEGENWVFEIANYKHRYPACWRCKTELVWKVADEWYVAMDKKTKSKTLREMMVGVTKKIDWIPEFGLERELDWLKNMRDWLISKKNRYWGLALPIYECNKCGAFEVIGGKEELKERAIEGWEKFEGKSPHKPWIDEVKIKCQNCGCPVSRIPDVGNPWLDAGIVPFSTLSYLADKNYWRDWFPADFITESFPGQFKNWFYSLIVMSTVLENTNPFKTVMGFATVLGEDGRAMHKSWGNAIEFNEGADKIGVDVMRWLYISHDPAQNLLFGFKKADEVRRRFFLILWNVYNFFITYALVDSWRPEAKLKISENILDRWIISRLNQTIAQSGKLLEKYDSRAIADIIENFVNDLSIWYVRRSRSRIGPSAKDGQDKKAAYQTLHAVLVSLSQILAPMMPFISEEIYRNLTGEESVHLADWPSYNEKLIDKELEEKMVLARLIVGKGHALRKEKGIKVRQPLNKLKISKLFSNKMKISKLVSNKMKISKLVSNKMKISKLVPPAAGLKIFDDEQLLNLVREELNVKGVDIVAEGEELSVELDTELTPELIAEGKAREIIREIQEARKAAGTSLDEYISVELPEWPENYENYIKKETLTAKLVKGESLKLIRNAS